jgi:crotonobetainyl-CoA hydratase
MSQNEFAPVATVEKKDGIAVITLNRPHALNAVNAEISATVGAALADLDADPALHVGIVTGAGRAFCAGADVKEIAAGRSVADPDHPEWGFAGLVEHQLTKPLIAAVNGYALGGGTEIVLACDLAVLSDEAALGLPEVKLGLFAAAGGVIRLARQMPKKLAMEAALTGEAINAADALRWGIVNRVVPAGGVLTAALEIATVIAGNAPLSVRASKRLLEQASGTNSAWDREVWEANDEEMAGILASADAREGLAAFAAKRRPTWTGS